MKNNRKALTKYETNVEPRFTEIKKWIIEGLTDEQIAERLDIHVSMIYEYKKKHPEFAEVIDRKSKWETHILPRLKDIQQWCEDGLTNQVICSRLDIPESTWYEYQNKYPILLELVRMSKSVMDTKVENALLNSALGYDYEEIKTIVEEDKNGKKRTRIEKTKKHMPANPAAQAFWLKNRKRDEWNERKEIVFDTKAQEEERKRLFLNMIKDDVFDADYSIANEEISELKEPEITEETDEGFIDETDNNDYNGDEENSIEI